MISHAFARLARRAGLSLLAVLCACAAALPGAHAAEDYGQGLLWKIEKPGYAPSYLFGTIHIADPRVTALPEPVQSAFDAAQSFTMETTLDAEGMAALATQMVYDDGRDLASVIGQPLFDRLAPMLGDYGLQPELLVMFKPWAVTVLLSVPPGQDPQGVLDYLLYTRAQERHKPAHFLESTEEQVAVFQGMPEADQVALLRATVDTHDGLAGQVESMVQAYLARDLDKLHALGEQGLPQGDAAAAGGRFETRVLTDRNQRMAERMEPRLKEGSAFIAVGALHLYGARGIPALLQARGWRVTRVY